MSKKVEDFIENLKNFEDMKDVFNPWKDKDIKLDTDNAADNKKSKSFVKGHMVRLLRYDGLTILGKTDEILINYFN